MPGQWDQYTRLDAAERLVMAGVILPATTVFALVDSILERTEKWMQDPVSRRSPMTLSISRSIAASRRFFATIWRAPLGSMGLGRDGRVAAAPLAARLRPPTSVGSQDSYAGLW